MDNQILAGPQHLVLSPPPNRPANRPLRVPLAHFLQNAPGGADSPFQSEQELSDDEGDEVDEDDDDESRMFSAVSEELEVPSSSMGIYGRRASSTPFSDEYEDDEDDTDDEEEGERLYSIRPPVLLSLNERSLAEEDQASFPLMRLPAELRLAVYRFCLMRPKPLLLHIEKPSPPSRPEFPIGQTIEPVHQRSPAERCDTTDTGPSSGTQLSRTRVLEDFPIPSQSAASPPPSPPPSSSSPSSSRVRTTDRSRKSDVVYKEANDDPVNAALLRVSKEVYHEARPVLYKENTFLLHLPSATYTLSTLHQRSRTLIPSIRIAIPTHHDILEEFANLVRLGLRYCWGLKTFTIRLPPIPDERPYGTNPTSSSNVYAGAFHILRWLPRGTEVVLEGGVPAEVRRVVEEGRTLAKALDEKAYARRQHQQTGGT